MNAHAIELEGLGKRYRLGEDFTRYGYRTFRDSLSLRRDHSPPLVQPREIWALRDLNLSIDAGEVVGVIGRNGAGKSTLLKLLARITEPTTGIARTKGRVGALLEVGTGFHTELTGRENVYLNASILGMPRREIGRVFDEIVEFAGVGDFLDTPLKRYSSGMRLRLAFAVAAHVQPSIVAVDEVLAVGDIEFQQRCLGTMAALGETGRTVIFVSHDLAAISQLCERTIWLENGAVAKGGPTGEVIAAYLDSHTTHTLHRELEPTAGMPAHVLSVELTDESGHGIELAHRDRPLGVRVSFEISRPLTELDLSIYLVNGRGVKVVDELFSDARERSLATDVGRYVAHATLPPVLAADDYTLGVWLGGGDDTFVLRDVFTFQLWPRPDDAPNSGSRLRVVQPGVRWHVERQPGG